MLRHTGIWTRHFATPRMQVRFLSRVMLLHVCNKQGVKLNITGVQLHSGHLLLWWRVARREQCPGWRTASFRGTAGLHQLSYLCALHIHWMRDSGHIQQVKHMTLWMQVCSEHTHSSSICTRKASWGEQGSSSRREHTTLLRAELPGSWSTGKGHLWIYWRE
jgi:hypothetical protein